MSARAKSQPTPMSGPWWQRHRTVSRAGLLALVSGAALVVVCTWWLGIGVGWAIAVALPCTAFVLLLGVTAPANDVLWQPLPADDRPPATLQASQLASRFAEAAVDPYRYRDRVRPRLARLALASLRQRTETADLTSLADPRAADVLGTDLHRLLTDPAATMPNPRDLALYLEKLEEL